jgi:riboflavin biosynthesis pyrimidine reductase
VVEYAMRRLWPDPAELDEAALIEAYAPDPDRPVRLNFVASLDGAVTLDGASAGLSSAADRRVFGLLRMHCDALLVGAGTLRHEGYHAVRLDETRRSWRRAHGRPEYPTLVVVSGSLNLDPGQAAFADAPVRPVVLTHAAAPPDRRAAMEAVTDVVACGETAVDLTAGLAALRRRGLALILSEGGPKLCGSLLAEGLVDELCLTISPLFAGPGAGRLVDGPRREIPVGMSLVHVLTEEGALLTRYARGEAPTGYPQA